MFVRLSPAGSIPDRPGGFYTARHRSIIFTKIVEAVKKREFIRSFNIVFLMAARRWLQVDIPPVRSAVKYIFRKNMEI